ncbi:hypothetical protein BDR26DRAFT_50638 [Obelidium mucronatum]|nr:hypothetical protein BDR26DRAFT_50638 [Obelidium mucronatum]
MTHRMNWLVSLTLVYIIYLVTPAAAPKRTSLLDKLRIGKKAGEAEPTSPVPAVVAPAAESAGHNEEKALPPAPQEQNKDPLKVLTGLAQKFKKSPNTADHVQETVTLAPAEAAASSSADIATKATTEGRPTSPFFQNLKKNFAKASEKAVEVGIVVGAKVEETAAAAKKNLEQEHEKQAAASASAAAATAETKVETAEVKPAAAKPTFYDSIKKNFTKASEKAVEVGIVVGGKVEETAAAAKKNLQKQQEKPAATATNAATEATTSEAKASETAVEATSIAPEEVVVVPAATAVAPVAAAPVAAAPVAAAPVAAAEEKPLPAIEEQKVEQPQAKPTFYENIKRNLVKANDKAVELGIIVGGKVEETAAAAKKTLQQEHDKQAAASTAAVAAAAESEAKPAESAADVKPATSPSKAKAPLLDNLKKTFAKASEKAVEVGIVVGAKVEETAAAAKKNLQEQEKQAHSAAAPEVKTAETTTAEEVVVIPASTSTSTAEVKPSETATTTAAAPKEKTQFFATLKRNFTKAGEKAAEVAAVVETKVEETVAAAKKKHDGDVGASSSKSEESVQELKSDDSATSPSKKSGFARSLSIPKIFLSSKPSAPVEAHADKEAIATDAVPSVSAAAAEASSPVAANEKRFSVKNLFNKKPVTTAAAAVTVAEPNEAPSAETKEEPAVVEPVSGSSSTSSAPKTGVEVENEDVKKVEEAVVVAANEATEQTATVQSVAEVKEVVAA